MKGTLLDFADWKEAPMLTHFLFYQPHPKGAHSGKFVCRKMCRCIRYIFKVDECILKWRKFTYLNTWKRKELRIRREA